MKQKLSLLRKIAESACRYLIVNVGGENFEIGLSDECVEIVHAHSCDRAKVETLSEMAVFICTHSPYKLSVTDYHLYVQVVQEAMEYALTPAIGMNKASMEVLIGSFAESQPEESGAFLRYLKTI